MPTSFFSYFPIRLGSVFYLLPVTRLLAPSFPSASSGGVLFFGDVMTLWRFCGITVAMAGIAWWVKQGDPLHTLVFGGRVGWVMGGANSPVRGMGWLCGCSWRWAGCVHLTALCPSAWPPHHRSVHARRCPAPYSMSYIPPRIRILRYTQILLTQGPAQPQIVKLMTSSKGDAAALQPLLSASPTDKGDA